MPRSRFGHESPTAESAAWAPPRVGVCAATPDERLLARAGELAAELRLDRVAADGAGCDLLLVVADDGLELREIGHGAAGDLPSEPRPAGSGPRRPDAGQTARCRSRLGLRVDFGEGGATARRLATASRRQPLARAVGFKKHTPTIIDATAGLGRDALWLARLGCTVTAIERSAVLGAMLRDALGRMMPPPAGLTLVIADAVDVLTKLTPDESPDVVYLDPMFPPRGKSALPKKEMRILRRLVGDDADAGAVLDAARRVARDRVVVKRTPHAPPLAPEPTVSYRGKLARYDAYLTRV